MGQTVDLVSRLKNANQDFEFYPANHNQIETLVNDLKSISNDVELTFDYSINLKVLGASNGQKVKLIKRSLIKSTNSVDMLTNEFQQNEILSLSVTASRPYACVIYKNEFENKVRSINKVTKRKTSVTLKLTDKQAA